MVRLCPIDPFVSGVLVAGFEQICKPCKRAGVLIRHRLRARFSVHMLTKFRAILARILRQIERNAFQHHIIRRDEVTK